MSKQKATLKLMADNIETIVKMGCHQLLEEYEETVTPLALFNNLVSRVRTKLEEDVKGMEQRQRVLLSQWE